MEKRYTKSKIIILSIAIVFAILSFSIGIFGIITNKKINYERDNETEAANYWLMKPGYKYTINGHYGNVSDIPDYIYRNFTISAELTCNTTTEVENEKKSWMSGDLKYYDKSGNVCLIFPVKNVLYFTGSHKYSGWYDIQDIANNGTPKVKNQYGLELYNAFKNYNSKKAVIPIHWNGTTNDDLDNTCTRNVKAESEPSKDGTFKKQLDYSYDGTYFWEKTTYDNGKKRSSTYTYGENGDAIFYSTSTSFNIYYTRDLYLFSKIFNDGLITQSPKVYLKADLSNVSIDCIGTTSRSFMGTFDGQGHTISNLSKNVVQYGDGWSGRFQCYGMFYNLAGTIKNLQIDNTKWTIDTRAYIAGTSVGILVSETSNNATIQECLITNSSITFYTNEIAPRCGTIIGWVSGATVNIYNCAVFVDLTAILEPDTMGSSGMGIGGFVGANNATLNVENSYFNGNFNIETYDECFLGGISGSFATNTMSVGVLNVKNTYVNFKSLSVNVQCSDYSNFTKVYVHSLGKGINTNSGNKYYFENYSIIFPEDWTDEGYNYILNQNCEKKKLF